jgi:eukaryotic-like serine/threonine-protein kinase
MPRPMPSPRPVESARGPSSRRAGSSEKDKSPRPEMSSRAAGVRPAPAKPLEPAEAPALAPTGSKKPSWMGKRVGRFKLLGLLGQGAMGRVFRAEDTLLRRHVALKVLSRNHQRGSRTVAAERLIREARAAASLEHPHIASIYEMNHAGGVHYIAMELVEGGSLRELIRAAGPMDPVHACQLAAEAAEALACAHSQGVVHRDIKPANLMLTRNGRCKVVDFGLARVEERADVESAMADSVGTPQFVAPEIVVGSPASPRSDVYSLAATLWYLLTGRPPFTGRNTEELLHRVIHDPLPDVRTLRPDASAGLAQALHKGLSRDPSKRYSSASQFAKVIRVHTIPVAPPPAGVRPDAAGDTQWSIAGTGACDVAVVSTDFVAAVPFEGVPLYAPAEQPEHSELDRPDERASEFAGLSELADVVATRLPPAPPAAAAPQRRDSPWMWVALGAAPLLILALALIAIAVFR